jgi:hypothetical protein
MQRRHPSPGAGAYMIGPVVPNPTLMFSSSVAFPAEDAHARQQAFPEEPSAYHEPSDEAVTAAIERLTHAPGNDPAALQQAALDMELVVRHVDSLTEAFGLETALTSVALNLVESSNAARGIANTRRVNTKARIIRTGGRVPLRKQ